MSSCVPVRGRQGASPHVRPSPGAAVQLLTMRGQTRLMALLLADSPDHQM